MRNFYFLDLNLRSITSLMRESIVGSKMMVIEIILSLICSVYEDCLSSGVLCLSLQSYFVLRKQVDQYIPKITQFIFHPLCYSIIFFCSFCFVLKTRNLLDVVNSISYQDFTSNRIHKINVVSLSNTKEYRLFDKGVL